MRLAVFTNQFPSLTGTFFARDMRGLIEAGIDIDVFPVYPLDPNLWRYVSDILNEKILPRNRIHHVNLGESVYCLNTLPFKKLRTCLFDITAIASSSIRYGIEPLTKSIYAIAKALALAKTHGNDVYDHILAYWGNYTATCAYVFHRLTAPEIPFSIFLHASIDLYKDTGYTQEKLLYADKIITCSNFNREFIRSSFRDIGPSLADKIYVHDHGLDLHQFSFEANSRPARKIIAVGRFAKQKGFDYLLRAVHELKSRGMNLDLELVGDGEEAQPLRSLAQQLGIMQSTRFRGWLPADEVPLAIRQATLLVHPSPDLGDGVPNVIKEAMALGTPVIGSRVAGIPELLDDGRCGFVVPPKDVKALADAIETMLANDSLRLKYADAARKRVEEKYDLWHNGHRLAAILRATEHHDVLSKAATQ